MTAFLSSCQSISTGSDSYTNRTLSVCEALEQKTQLVGKRISVRGRTPNLQHGTGIFQSDCRLSSSGEVVIPITSFKNEEASGRSEWTATYYGLMRTGNDLLATYTGQLVYNTAGNVIGFEIDEVSMIEVLDQD